MSSATEAGGAAQWAATVQPGTPVRWKELELAAWHGNRGVLRAMEPGRHRSSLIWLSVAVVLVLSGPILGFALIMGSRFDLVDVSRPARLPWTSLFFLISDLVLVPLAIWVLFSSATRRGSRGLGLYALLLGGASALMGYRAGQDPDVERPWLLLAPIIVAALAGLVLLIASRSGPRPSRAEELSTQDRAAASRRATISSAVDQVPTGERRAVEQDLRLGIQDLQRRGVIPAEEAQRALDAPPGGLSHHMAQRGG